MPVFRPERPQPAVRYQDDRGYEYMVLPNVWLGGYRTFRRKYRRSWRPVKELPWRVGLFDAAMDLAAYAKEKGLTRV